jgi:CDP-glucose 4,6-dehydratase
LKLDSTKARNELGWRPKLSLDEAIKLTSEWYRAFRDEKDLIELTASQIDFYQSNHAD